MIIDYRLTEWIAWSWSGHNYIEYLLLKILLLDFGLDTQNISVILTILFMIIDYWQLITVIDKLIIDYLQTEWIAWSWIVVDTESCNLNNK